MQLSCEAFDTLMTHHDGSDISVSFSHECLHSIAFTHAKVLSIPCHKFIDPNSPHYHSPFISHTGKNNFFSLSLLAYCIFISNPNFDSLMMISSFDDLPPSDLDDIMGLSLKHLGHHLHIVWSISILDQFCGWKTDDPPLDYFLHIGGTPMIIVGNILIQDDVQHTLTWLLQHVASPSLASIHSSSKLCSYLCKS